MKKTVINENQLGLLYKNGVLTKILGAGKYTLFGGQTVEVLSAEDEIAPQNCTVQKFLGCLADKNSVSEITVRDGEIALHYVDSVYKNVLRAGRHIFSNACGKHEFKVYNTAEPKITDIPATVLTKLAEDGHVCVMVEVPNGANAVVFFDEKPAEYVGTGRYFYWNYTVRITAKIYNMKKRILYVQGQEILTKDKAAVRVNFTADWRITDYKKINDEFTDIGEIVNMQARLALRDYLGSKTMDELLENREACGAEVLELFRKRVEGISVEILSAGIVDVILPGKISDIMNSVLEAEKRAQANVITRREEVASTRSLLNTAKLMDENATLRRLKEMEYIERICDKVGEINVGSRGDLLSQLSKILGSEN